MTVRRCRPLLGTFVEITCPDEAAIEKGYAAIGTVQQLMSAHDFASDLSRVNREAHLRPVAVHSWTAEVITRAGFWAKASGGEFDAVRAGAIALVNGLIPRHAEQPEPDPEAGWSAVQIGGERISFAVPACLDLGGIAKGFAVDKAVEAMRDFGAASGLVNAGGDLRGFGDEIWTITVKDPLSHRALLSLDISNVALATSAGHPGSGGTMDYSHLPRADQNWTSMTVRAPTACDADALAKIAISAGPTAHDCLASVQAQAVGITKDGFVKPIHAPILVAG